MAYVSNTNANALKKYHLGLGKFSQRTNFEWNVFVKNRMEVNDFYENPYVDVIYACYLTERIVQLTLRSKKEHTKPSRQSHIVNGEF